MTFTPTQSHGDLFNLKPMILNLYLYGLLFRFSTVLTNPISTPNSNLTNIQRLLIMILFISLRMHLAYSFSIFLETCFSFSVVFKKFSKYLEMIEDSPNFALELKSLFALCIQEALQYFGYCENSKNTLCLSSFACNT